MYRKKNKGKINLLVSSNTDGNEKPKLIIIEMSKNPRCFTRTKCYQIVIYLILKREFFKNY